MSTALAVLEKQDEQTRVDARELQGRMGLVGDFSTWIAYQIERFQLIEGKDFGVSLNVQGYLPQGGKPQKNYWLSFNTAKMIALSQNSPAARSAHQHLIDLENKWNTPALIVARALQIAHAELLAFQTQMQEWAPKVLGFDRFINLEGTKSITEVARMLGIGRDIMFLRLEKDKLIFVHHVTYDKDGNTKNHWRATAYARGGGWLENKTGVTESGVEYMFPVVTRLGIAYLTKKYARTDKDGSVAVIKAL